MKSLLPETRLLSAALVLACVDAPAFECPPVQPSTSRQPAYGPVPGAGRCEGFYNRTVSQPFLEVVSFTLGPALTADAAGPVQVRSAARQPVRLVVQPLRSVPYYRLDAELPPRATWSWDPQPMLAATGLRPDDLGFLALGSRPGTAGSTPVSAVALGPPAADEGSTAVAMVRASVDIQSLAWRTYRLGASNATPAWNPVPDSQRYAWQRVALRVPLPDDGKALALDIQATEADTGRLLPILRLSVIGPNDD